MASELDDFEYQLRAEKSYPVAASSIPAPSTTYVDPSDGTVYEWVDEQKGWFPKVSRF